MINCLRNRPLNWRDYVDEKKTKVGKIVFKEGTPPEMLEQYKEHMKLLRQGLRL